MPTEKIYAPFSAKAREGRFGIEFRLSANAEKLVAFIRAHTNTKGYVNMQMSPRKETGKFGDTHVVTLDTWDPPKPVPVAEEDIPF